MTPSKKWLEEYNKKIDIMRPESSLEKYFTDKEIAGNKIDVISMGKIKITSGEIIACDPIAYLDNDTNPFFDKFPCGEFEVTASIIIDEERIAAVKIQFTDETPVKYREALYGDEPLDEIETQGDFFGYPVDSGMGCFIDRDAAEKLSEFIVRNEENNDSFNLYQDYFAEFLEKNAKSNPKYQREDGDWVNMPVPESDGNMVIFSSGYGDGYYPAYIAEDKNGNICQLVTQFIDAELDDDEE